MHSYLQRGGTDVVLLENDLHKLTLTIPEAQNKIRRAAFVGGGMFLYSAEREKKESLRPIFLLVLLKHSRRVCSSPRCFCPLASWAGGRPRCDSGTFVQRGGGSRAETQRRLIDKSFFFATDNQGKGDSNFSSTESSRTKLCTMPRK